MEWIAFFVILIIVAWVVHVHSYWRGFNEGSEFQRGLRDEEEEAKRIPVLFIGIQDCVGLMPDWIMVNDPATKTTIAYDPNKHWIVNDDQMSVEAKRIMRSTG